MAKNKSSITVSSDPRFYETLKGSISGRRWAWEFLRRNRDYIAACLKVKTNEEKADIALQFGLFDFKDFREDYRKGVGKPTFLLGGIRSWSVAEQGNPGVVDLKIAVAKGEVVIKFNVANSVQDNRSISRQLYRAEKLLTRKREELQIKVGKTRATQKSRLQQYVKILDGYLHGLNPKDAYIAAYSHHKGKCKEELGSNPAKAVKKALEYANDLYRYLPLQAKAKL